MRPRILLALAAPCVLACESIVSHSPVLPATYALEAPVTRQSPGVRTTVIADTLRLGVDGAAVRSTRASIDYESRGDTTVTSNSIYRYELKGGIIELTYLCGPAELCSPPPHYRGRFENGDMILREAHGDEPAVRYRRVD